MQAVLDTTYAAKGLKQAIGGVSEAKFNYEIGSGEYNKLESIHERLNALLYEIEPEWFN